RDRNVTGVQTCALPISHILDRLQRGRWDAADVTAPPPDSTGTDYAEHVRELADSPARYNANPKFLHEASGCAGKLMVFAVRTRRSEERRVGTEWGARES